MTWLFLLLSLLNIDDQCDGKKIVALPAFYSEKCEHFEDNIELKQCADKEMLQFLYSELKYPSQARENRTEGRVYIFFNIDVEGYPYNFEIRRGIGSGCDEAALEVVEQFEFWPALNECGDPMETKGMVVPVTFKLEN